MHFCCFLFSCGLVRCFTSGRSIRGRGGRQRNLLFLIFLNGTVPLLTQRFQSAAAGAGAMWVVVAVVAASDRASVVTRGGTDRRRGSTRALMYRVRHSAAAAGTTTVGGRIRQRCRPVDVE